MLQDTHNRQPCLSLNPTKKGSRASLVYLLARNLEQHIRHEEDDERDIVLVAVQAELRGHAVDVGVGDVDAVEEGQEVEDAEEGDDVPVDARDQFALGGVRGAWDGQVGVVGVVVVVVVVVVAEGASSRVGLGVGLFVEGCGWRCWFLSAEEAHLA